MLTNKPPDVDAGIDQKTLNEKLGFIPHSAKQAEYVYSQARFNTACCGRRWGKSMAAGHRMTHKMFAPNTYNWVVGHTYRTGEKEFRVVWNDFKKLGILKYCKKAYSMKQGNMRIETPWGSFLEVVSAEKQDSLLGEGLSHAIMSETAKHDRSTWEQYIEPALSDLRGSCDFPSTPQGFNWFHGLWFLGQQKDVAYKDYASWQFPSWTNTYRYPGGINNDEIQRVKRTASKEYFLQEYGAQFTAVTGAIYNEWDDKIHVQPCEYNPALPNYVTFDYGFANPFVALDVQVAPDDTAYVWREYYGRYQSTMEHGIAIRDRKNPKNYHVDSMWGDPSGADAAATLALIIGFIGSQRVPWGQSVEQIKRMLRHDNKPAQIIVSPNCPNLIREMPQLHVRPISRQATQALNETHGDGNIQHKVDDHCCDALRYFVGPHFVLGAGSHLEDVYGQDYIGSESQHFMTTITGQDSKMTIGFGREHDLSFGGNHGF